MNDVTRETSAKHLARAYKNKAVAKFIECGGGDGYTFSIYTESQLNNLRFRVIWHKSNGDKGNSYFNDIASARAFAAAVGD